MPMSLLIPTKPLVHDREILPPHLLICRNLIINPLHLPSKHIPRIHTPRRLQRQPQILFHQPHSKSPLILPLRRPPHTPPRYPLLHRRPPPPSLPTLPRL